MYRPALLRAAFAALYLAMLSACTDEIVHNAPAPTPVRVAAAIAGPGAPSIRATGVVLNKDEVRLSFKVGGVVKYIAVREGEHVRKGQRIAEIERTEVNAQVEQARQAHEKAQRDLERGERLHADNVISLEQLQDLRTQLAVARAALESVQFNLNHAVIIAPRDGTVVRRLAEERELVAAGAPVLILGTQDMGYVVRTGLADREIVQVALGDTAQIRLDALPDAKLHGKITELASAADPASGLFVIGVSIETDLPLKSGLIAKLTVIPSSALASSRVYIPISSLIEGNEDRAIVYVLESGHAQRRDVLVAFIEGESVALSGGIAAGEQVITDGALYLEDGEAVSVLEREDFTQSAQRSQSGRSLVTQDVDLKLKPNKGIASPVLEPLCALCEMS